MHDPSCEYYAEGGALPSFDQTVESTPVSAPPQAQPTQSQSDTLPAFEDTHDAALPSFDSTKPTNHDKYGTTGQQILTAVEGAGQGFAGPVATLAEKGLNKLGVEGFTDEDIAGRAAENPLIHGFSEAGGLAAGLLTGTGELGLIAKGAKAIPMLGKLEAAGTLGKVGSAAIKGFIESGGVQAGDEISKAMLGQGDPHEPVSNALAHIGAAGLLGGITGGAFNVTGQGASKGLQALENTRMGEKAHNIAVGMGVGSLLKEAGIPANQAEEWVNAQLNPGKVGGLGLSYKELKPGIEAFEAMAGKAKDAATSVVETAAGTVGGNIAGVPGAIISMKVADKLISPFVAANVDKVTKKYASGAILKLLASGETDGAAKVVSYARNIAKGENAITKGMNALFKTGGQQAVNYAADENDREKLREFIEKGGVDQQIQNQIQSQPQSYAEGGPVIPEVKNEPDTLGTVFPDQNQLLNTAKGRVSNYLNSTRPLQQSKLPFDVEMPNKEQERSYNRALDIANKPLSVLGHIQDGTLTAEHLKHLVQMYPELHDHLSKKMTEKIAESQMKEEKPAYKVRQGMSIFLGTPLDSTMTPAGIQAAQPQPKPQPQQQGKTRKGTSTLGKSNADYRTQSQNAEHDRNSRA